MTRAEPQPVPPKIRTAPSLTFFAIAVSSFVVAGGLAFVYSFNPSTHGFYPTCLFHQLTGLNCPGCGATRSLYALLHGNLSIALRDNALFVLSLGAGGIFGARFLLEKWRNPRAQFHLPPKFIWSYLVVAVVFAVARNLPAFSFLSP
ncbi:MAG: DUF2752 domain-containing protein [Limisphaerales bacterium]